MSLSEKIKIMFKNDASETEKAQETETPETESETVEEWIWVTGFKGTDKDMCCRGYQFALGEVFNMPDDTEIKECESGFHFCNYLYQAQRYYPVRNNNRFFVVAGLVRKKDYERHGDKLAAKSIKFLNELTVDQILEPFFDAEWLKDWSEDDKQLALSVGVDQVIAVRARRELVTLGYSETFAGYLIDIGKYEIAKVAASQPELSMDMKVLMIFMEKHRSYQC